MKLFYQTDSKSIFQRHVLSSHDTLTKSIEYQSSVRHEWLDDANLCILHVFLSRALAPFCAWHIMASIMPPPPPPPIQRHHITVFDTIVVV
jgi:hypothetical protein